MIQFWLLVVCCLHFVMTQMLFESQHGALMAVYDALGACGRLLASTSPVMHFIRFFFFVCFRLFHTGCNSTTCERFNSSTNCPGREKLDCLGGVVTGLCVLSLCDSCLTDVVGLAED
jgi:hypothetical protein